MISASHAVSLMCAYLEEASAICTHNSASFVPELKDDDTYVTDVDLRLSELAVSMFSPVFGEDHVITEEHQGVLPSLSQTPSVVAEETFIIIDPIDGTRNFVFGIPLYGVSVGVLKQGKPWLGGTAFPALHETFVFDGMRLEHFKGNTPVRSGSGVLVSPHTRQMDTQSLICSSENLAKHYSWDYGISDLRITGCTVMDVCWPLINRCSAAFFYAKIWDLAGAWPMLMHMGYELTGVESKNRYSDWCLDDFSGNQQFIKEFLVVSQPHDTEKLIDGLMRLD